MTGADEAGARKPAAAPSEPSLLALLDLSPEQEAVYRRLVDRPGSEAVDLEQPGSGGVPVAHLLDTLLERGLVVADRSGSRDVYRAASPALALGPLLESRRVALAGVERAVAELAERHRAAQSRTGGGGPVEVLAGVAAIRQRLLAMQRDARHQLRTLVPRTSAPAVITIEDNYEAAEADAMRRGVLVRSVVDRAWFADPVRARMLVRLVEDGQQVSISPDLPVKLVVADDDVALLPLDPARDEVEEPVALVVHRSGLLTALTSLFEQYFRSGWLLHPGSQATQAPAGTGPDAVDRQILALLRVGLTDAAIARQLGVGHRTVQRRLHALMASVGAATRFQLGFHAAAAGWFDEQEPAGA